MKYTCELVINLPRERMVKLFDDPENMVKWMDGLQRFEHISGVEGQPGAQSRLVFERDNGETFDMIETLTRYNLPDEISGTYETEGVRNVIENWFIDEGPNATRWVAHNVFEFGGFMRIASWFMRPLFKRQSLKIMHSFKVFAESTALASEELEDGGE